MSVTRASSNCSPSARAWRRYRFKIDTLSPLDSGLKCIFQELNNATSSFLLVTSPCKTFPPAWTYCFIAFVAPEKSLRLRYAAISSRFPHPRLYVKLTRASNWFWFSWERQSQPLIRPKTNLGRQEAAIRTYSNMDVLVDARNESSGVRFEEILALGFGNGSMDAVALRFRLAGMAIANGQDTLWGDGWVTQPCRLEDHP